MRILLIGNGFLALPIIERLDSEGHTVSVFSRKAKNHIKVPQIEGDILKSDDWKEVLRNSYQVVINTAWITNHIQYQIDEINKDYARSAISLAKEAAKARVEHFIGFGSCAEYGLQLLPCVAGKTLLKPGNLYAKQKVETFEKTMQLLLSTKTRFSWLRVFQPYGPMQDPRRLVPYLISRLKSKSSIEIEDSRSLLDWVTTRDIASAVSWVLNNSVPGEIDIATSVGHTNLDVLNYLEALLGKAKEIRLLNQSPERSTQCLVAGRGSPIFTSGWRPGDTLETGLEWVVRNA